MATSTVGYSARKSLRQKILQAALKAPDFRTLLVEAADEIREIAKPTATEATIEGAFERILYAQLKEIGLRFHPEKESAINLKRHVARGRADSRLGALIIEYKRPALLKSTGEREAALTQLKSYVTALSQTTDTPFVGLLTNGLVAIEVQALRGSIIAQSSLQSVDWRVLLRLTQHVVSLALTALTPANLIRDFCGSRSDGVLFQMARVLNDILSGPQPKTQMLFQEWEQMFRLAHDDQSQQRRIEDRRAALAELFETEIDDADEEYRALFALHTAYAILLKFIAYRTVSDLYFKEVGQDFRSLAFASSPSLRVFCNGLEDGEIFRQLKMINLLEGDFFSWYCDKKQWTPDLANSMRAMVEILARYEEAENVFDSNEAPDLFRDLYQAAVPQVVRSSFGEFYTPYWLAQHVLESASPVDNWRALDPCCGSGTFVVASIARLRAECRARGLNERDTLREILSRVVAIDLNPLGVLTTRINYFIHISNLFAKSGGSLVIPVYLGDASSIPARVVLEGVECLHHELATLKKPVSAILPISLAKDTTRFMRLMFEYEQHIKARDHDAARQVLLNGVPADERKFLVRKHIRELTENLIELERNGWNGIWARILSNFLTTACLGRFSVIIGNPPWIDWKNLPEQYRNRTKQVDVVKSLFSGAGRTGGINLNICALISYVAMVNWLDEGGQLAFLMPRELVYQASYEGWRRLNGKYDFLTFYDWTKAGHPFDPVKEDFMTFVIGTQQRATSYVPVVKYAKKKSAAKPVSWKSLEMAFNSLEVSQEVAGQIIPNSTAFTFARDEAELHEFAIITGECEYIGRDGLQFYPQELQVFRYSGEGPAPNTVWVNNVQAQKAQHKVPSMRVLLEKTYLRPLVASPAIGRFRHDYDGLLAAFPHDASNPTRPISSSTLRESAPLLLAYYEKYRDVVESLSKANTKIRDADPGEFYGVGRVGPYSFAHTYIVFRKDTKWCAAVVSAEMTPWGEEKKVVFQSHAVSMCERRNREFIDEDEAHYICAILNTPIVERFVYATSDTRSFKVRPSVFVPLYDPDDTRHARLSVISREAHATPENVETLRIESETLYISICQDEAYEAVDAAVAAERLAEISVNPELLIRGDELTQALLELESE